jgi:Zn-dependent protease with chaperone function
MRYIAKRALLIFIILQTSCTVNVVSKEKLPPIEPLYQEHVECVFNSIQAVLPNVRARMVVDGSGQMGSQVRVNERLIIINRGLIHKPVNQLAGVIAHEFAHLAMRDEKFLSDYPGLYGRRLNELWADKLAVMIVQWAGFDPYGLSDYITSWGPDSIPEFASTHPSNMRRVQNIQFKIGQVKEPVIRQHNCRSLNDF